MLFRPFRLILSRDCLLHVFTCSVKGVVGVEDCGEEAEGESTDAEGHVKASVPETLEHLCTDIKQCLKMR